MCKCAGIAGEPVTSRGQEVPAPSLGFCHGVASFAELRLYNAIWDLTAIVVALAWREINVKVIAMRVVGFRTKDCTEYAARRPVGTA